MEENSATNNNPQTDNGHGKGPRPTKTNQNRKNNSPFPNNNRTRNNNRQSKIPYQNQPYQGQGQNYQGQGQPYQGQDNQYNQQYQGQNQGQAQNYDPRTQQGHNQNYDPRTQQGHNQNYDPRSQQGHNQNYDARTTKNPNPRSSGRRRGGGGGYRDEYQEGHPQQQHNRGGRPRANDTKINYLREKTNGYFPDETLYKVLEQYQDTEQALQYLIGLKFKKITCFLAQRKNSWSNVVLRTAPHFEYQQQAHEDVLPQDQSEQAPVDTQDYFQPHRKPQRHRKNQNKAQEPVPPKEDEVYNADAKIEAIQQALEHQLSAMESKADELKRLQEEIRKIKADRDVQIEQLITEKETLTQKFVQLKQDIEKTQTRLYAIDDEVTNLKQEKVDRIRSLEERTRVLLEDKNA